MFERYTVDAIADAIHTEIAQATPSARLSRRFQRRGKNDGRHNRSPATVKQLIADAVEVAGSRVCQEYLAQKRQLFVDQRVGESVLDQLDDADDGDGGGAPPPSDGGSELDGAAQLYERNRQARLAARARAENAAQEATVTTGIARSSATLEVLVDEAKQHIESCKRVGEYLWSAYTVGYERGQRRRLRRFPDPGAEISSAPAFDCPCELFDEDEHEEGAAAPGGPAPGEPDDGPSDGAAGTTPTAVGGEEG